MTSAIHLRACTRKQRHAVTSNVSRVIRDVGAWLMDVHLFSNIATAFNIEVAYDRLGALGSALGDCVYLDDESRSALSAPPPESELTHSEDGEVVVRLHLTFIHNEPPLARVIPHVPG